MAPSDPTSTDSPSLSSESSTNVTNPSAPSHPAPPPSGAPTTNPEPTSGDQNKHSGGELGGVSNKAGTALPGSHSALFGLEKGDKEIHAPRDAPGGNAEGPKV